MGKKELLRFSAIPFGYLMEFAGKIINREDVINLGHYLSCSGKDKILNPKFYPEIRRLYELFDNNIFTAHTFMGTNKLLDELQHSIGKFIFHKEDNKLKIEDYYVFYPLCFNPEEHFYDCNCPEYQKSWAHLEITKTIKICPIIRFKITTRIFTIDFDHWIYLEIYISDKFWTYFGKSFYTRATIQLEKGEN
jgi:hypothetical protein